jgi:uncharacterized NAD(P)/FAD-binding protein YdhS/glyoxylase-like metal-dependent hydrolase (beta-lactamase superfamily II)
MTSADPPITTAIIGAGFSGTMVAAHLLKTAHRPLRIKLVESSHEIGKGVAYSTTSDQHLLNVSAGKMSAYPGDPGHLLRWLHYNRQALAHLLPAEINASSFIPRQIYGLYLQSILEEAEATTSSTVRLDRVYDEAIAVRPTETGAVVSLKSGSLFPADKIVLALGNTSAGAAASFLSETSNSQGYIRDAWSADALSDLEADATILLVGTGLTMVDMVVSLWGRQHQGRIHAISRRGLLPLSHEATKPYPVFLTPERASKSVTGLFEQIRREVETATAQGFNWRSVIDSLRPITQQLWHQLPRTEQKRFIRHASPYWDVHRHRIAPGIWDIFQALLVAGQLTVQAGHIERLHVVNQHLEVIVRERKTQTKRALEVDRVINCTGVQIDYRRSSPCLIANLLEQGFVRANDLGLGLSTDPEGNIIDAQGRSSSLLYTLGTPRKGDLWETIAVPELREQAQTLAATLLKTLPARVRPVAPLSQPVTSTSEDAFISGDVRPSLSDSLLLFRQLFDPESSTYTYLIADRQAKEAVLVDTVLEQAERDLQVLDDLNLNLRYCLETHIHADHITGAGRLRQQTGCQIIVPEHTTSRSADQTLSDREVLTLGSVQIEAIATPGHTASHMAYLVNGTYLLTGDALLIRGCGRTDLQSGDAGALFDSVTERLFSLPDDTLVYPAHDYKGFTVSTIGEEKRFNPRFADRSREQFIIIMSHLGLSHPKRMKEALPANEFCGDFIPESDSQHDDSSDPQQNADQVEQTLTTNTEIFESYFAMYI